MAITDHDRPMVDIDELERMAAFDSPSAPDSASSAEPGPAGTPDGAAAFALSGPGRILLASLAASAGVIHLVMVPSHAAQWLPEGIAFAVAGWLQIGLAVAFLARPSRAAVRASCLVNTVFIAAWVISRVSGFPFGPEAGVAHAASFVDVTCVVFEALLVLAGYELLLHPDRGARAGTGAQVAMSAVPVAIVLLATAAISSPSAASHAHGSAESASGAAGGAAHSHDGADIPASSATGGAAHDHSTAGATPTDDKGLSKLMNGQGEGGGHSHAVTNVPVDAETQRLLDAQLDQTRLLVDKYPTVQAAEDAGWRRSGPYSPGLGAHYTPLKFKLNPDGKMDPEDLESPTLIYDGVDPDSKLAGFMYSIYSLDTQNPPEGFVGPNDHWHYHTNVCLVPRPGGGVDAPLGADTSAPKELCDKYDGRLIANTGYMVHVWTVPGYESSQGVFSNVNPALACADGTYFTISLDEIGTKTTVCRDGSRGGRGA